MISLVAASAFLATSVMGSVQQPVVTPPTPCLIVTGSADNRTKPDHVGITDQRLLIAACYEGAFARVS